MSNVGKHHHVVAASSTSTDNDGTKAVERQLPAEQLFDFYNKNCKERRQECQRDEPNKIGTEQVAMQPKEDGKEKKKEKSFRGRRSSLSSMFGAPMPDPGSRRHSSASTGIPSTPSFPHQMLGRLQSIMVNKNDARIDSSNISDFGKQKNGRDASSSNPDSVKKNHNGSNEGPAPEFVALIAKKQDHNDEGNQQQKEKDELILKQQRRISELEEMLSIFEIGYNQNNFNTSNGTHNDEMPAVREAVRRIQNFQVEVNEQKMAITVLDKECEEAINDLQDSTAEIEQLHDQTIEYKRIIQQLRAENKRLEQERSNAVEELLENENKKKILRVSCGSTRNQHTAPNEPPIDSNDVQDMITDIRNQMKHKLKVVTLEKSELEQDLRAMLEEKDEMSQQFYGAIRRQRELEHTALKNQQTIKSSLRDMIIHQTKMSDVVRLCSSFDGDSISQDTSGRGVQGGKVVHLIEDQTRRMKELVAQINVVDFSNSSLSTCNNDSTAATAAKETEPLSAGVSVLRRCSDGVLRGCSFIRQPWQDSSVKDQNEHAVKDQSEHGVADISDRKHSRRKSLPDSINISQQAYFNTSMEWSNRVLNCIATAAPTYLGHQSLLRDNQNLARKRGSWRDFLLKRDDADDQNDSGDSTLKDSDAGEATSTVEDNADILSKVEDLEVSVKEGNIAIHDDGLLEGFGSNRPSSNVSDESSEDEEPQVRKSSAQIQNTLVLEDAKNENGSNHECKTEGAPGINTSNLLLQEEHLKSGLDLSGATALTSVDGEEKKTVSHYKKRPDLYDVLQVNIDLIRSQRKCVQGDDDDSASDFF